MMVLDRLVISKLICVLTLFQNIILCVYITPLGRPLLPEVEVNVRVREAKEIYFWEAIGLHELHL